LRGVGWINLIRKKSTNDISQVEAPGGWNKGTGIAV